MTLKPFSESINLESTELQKPNPVVSIASENVKADDASENKDFLKPFSEDIYGGPGSGFFDHEGRPGKQGGSLARRMSKRVKGGYSPQQVEFLLEQGLRLYEIDELGGLRISAPEEGFYRINNPADLSGEDILQKLCKIYGFVDVNEKTGRADHSIFPVTWKPGDKILSLPGGGEGAAVGSTLGQKEERWRWEHYNLAKALGVATEEDTNRLREGKDVSGTTWNDELWPMIDAMQHDMSDLTVDQIEALREVWPKKIEEALERDLERG